LLKLPVAKGAAILVIIGSAVAVFGSRGEASHDEFAYKFPCIPTDACYVTQLTHTGNAYDFDPQGSAGLGSIPAVSEGTFRGYVTQNDVCTYPGGSGLGKYAVIDDIHGRTLRYAHLSTFGGLAVDDRVLQGDIVGIEGNTGYAIDCAPHLHLEGIAGQSIDGNSSVGLGLYQSTNSRIGYHTPSIATTGSTAIRQLYYYLGALGFGPSWSVVGWTADWTGTQADCYPDTYCQLYVHYQPATQEGHWGLHQTFRKHPGAAVTDDGAIMVGRWTWNTTDDPSPDPYVVSPGAFAGWLGGYKGVGLPIAAGIGTSFPYCRAGVSCVAYQRFHMGYIWKHQVYGWQSPMFCPDVVGTTYQVLVDDILAVVGAYFYDDPGPIWEPWAEARYDTDGNGLLRIEDVSAVVGAYYEYCYP
jgi:hypothetical protein